MMMRFENWRIEDLRTGKEIAIRVMDEKPQRQSQKKSLVFSFQSVAVIGR